MPRRTRPRKSRQKHKHRKRPRRWHRTSKKPLWELALEMGITASGKAMKVDVITFTPYDKA